MRVGTHWLIDAHACRSEALRDVATLRALGDRVIARLALRVVGEPMWHAFAGEGGVTGIYLLSESHFALHTYPEHRLATLDLYSCHARAEVPWERELAHAIGAERVVIRPVDRGDA